MLKTSFTDQWQDRLLHELLQAQTLPIDLQRESQIESSQIYLYSTMKKQQESGWSTSARIKHKMYNVRNYI